MGKHIERRFGRIWGATMVAFGAVTNIGTAQPVRPYSEITDGFRGDQTRIAKDFYAAMRKVSKLGVEKAKAE